jgi:hypothetical protein
VTGGKPIAVYRIICKLVHSKHNSDTLTAGWSSGLRCRLRNQSSRVQTHPAAKFLHTKVKYLI